MKKVFIQTDNKWKNVSRYHASASDSLSELDQMLTDRISGKEMPDGNVVLSEYVKFGQAICYCAACWLMYAAFICPSIPYSFCIFVTACFIYSVVT